MIETGFEPSAVRGVAVWRNVRIAVLLACWLFFGPRGADAAPLNLIESPLGDVSTFSINVAYDHTTDTLTADGTGGFFYSVLEDSDYFLNNNVFSLTAALSPTGALIGGTIEIAGNDAPLYDGVLIEGNLTAFGFPSPPGSTNSPLEFEFDITGGALAAPGEPYYSATDNIIGGMILHMITATPAFGSGWTSTSFQSNTTNTSADTFPVTLTPTPEPSTFALFALGLLPLGWWLRRPSQHPAC